MKQIETVVSRNVANSVNDFFLLAMQHRLLIIFDCGKHAQTLHSYAKVLGEECPAERSTFSNKLSLLNIVMLMLFL